MAIKLIVSDLDDTLLNDASQLTERTLAALNRVKALGAHIALASGRMLAAMLPYANQIGIRAPLIALNGAATYELSTDNYLSRFLVPRDEAIAVCERAARENLYVQVFIDGGYFFEAENSYNRAYGAAVGVKGTAVLQPLADYIDRDCEKLLLIDDPARITAAEPGFSAQFSGRLNCFISRPRYLECTDIAASKGNAVRALAGSLHIEPDEIAAFGDAQNDLSMLAYAGHGYAMANARPEILAAIPRHAPSNDEDGVAQVLEQLLDAGAIVAAEKE